jgi:Glycogen recognition site of AMP-activated protein kinase
MVVGSLPIAAQSLLRAPVRWLHLNEPGHQIVNSLSMAKTTKTPKTNSKNNGTTGEPSRSVAAKTEQVRPIAPKAEPVKVPATQPTISLEFIKPGAKQVAVAGDFNDWKPERSPLVQIGNGRWVGDLAVKPGRHEYLFVVDGQWLPDPNARENVQNPYGGRNSVLIVSA